MTVAPITADRAGIITRLAAMVVDGVVLFVSLRGAVWFLEAVAHVLRRFAPPVDIATIVLAFAPVLVGAYHVLCWRLFGQTPGKWLLGVKVVAEGGGRVTLLRAIVRVFGYLLSALPFYAGFLWILGRNRLAWHDYLAHTEVVYVSRPRPPERRRSLPLGGISGALPSGAS